MNNSAWSGARGVDAVVKGGAATCSLLSWLTCPLPDDDAEYSRSDFALYFKKYLKTQTQKYLQPEDDNDSLTRSSDPIENDSVKSVSFDSPRRPNEIVNSVSVNRIINNEMHPNDNTSDKENSCNRPVLTSATADSENGKNHPKSVLRSNEDVDNTNSDKKTLITAESEVGNSEIFVTPQKLQSFGGDCLFSPVTPVNSSISSNSESSFIRYSTPNTNKAYHKGNNNLYNNKKTPNQRQNICIGDFLPKNSTNENALANKKKRNIKYLSLSSNDPILANNDRNASNRNDTFTDNFNINDKFMFPNIGMKKTHGNSYLPGNSRRINPTRLNATFPCPERETVPNKSENPKFGIKYDKTYQNDAFKIQNCQMQEHTKDFKIEREILRREKVNLIEKFNAISNNTPKKVAVSTMPVSIIPTKKSQSILIHFNIKKVTHKAILDRFSGIFSTLLNYNLVTNVTSEIYYLISLAVIKHVKTKVLKDQLESHKNDDIDDVLNSLFDTIDNCVYFAIATLEKQKYILEVILDSSCLKYLLNSERVKIYSVEFFDFLSEVYVKKIAIQEKCKDIPISEDISNKTVCFITDTDSPDNFPSRKSFITFKSLRDGFYAILRIWEKDHQKTGWKFELHLAPKVRNLLLTSDCPSNFAHFARLFKDQLLMTCSKQDISVETVAHLQSVIGGSGLNPSKISKLAERLTGTLPGQNGQPHQNELSSPPEFIGREEFFRDFIIYGANSRFREHLMDSLIQEILRLNDSEFTLTENEEFDNTIERETKAHYLSSICSLRIIAKFLGFLMAFPYDMNLSTPENIMEKEISLRYQTLPPINLIVILHKSRKCQRLILTIPWMVQLLSMLDYCSLRLQYFENLLNILFEIYADTLYKPVCNPNLEDQLNISETTDLQIPDRNNALIRICLGWLFDMQHFPQKFFHSWFINSKYKIHERDKLIKLSQPIEPSDEQPDIEKKSTDEKSFNSNDIKNFYNISLEAKNNECSLDILDIIDDSVIKEICPYLKEFKALILRNRKCKPDNTSRNIRHITPLTSSFQSDNRKTKYKELQMRLEEWFLRSQPSTTKSTLELVGERTGSALVRLVKVQSMTGVDSSEFYAGCLRAGKQIAVKRTHDALQSLLPPGTPTPIFNICVEICTRNALKRLNQCLQTQFSAINVTLSNVQDDDKSVTSCDLNKINENCNDPGIEETYVSPTMVVIDLKDLLVKLMNCTYNLENIAPETHRLLTNIEGSCKHPYIDKSTKDMMIQLTLDLIIFIICVKPSILDQVLFDLISMAWTACWTIEEECEEKSTDNSNEEIEFFRKLVNPNHTTKVIHSDIKVNKPVNDSVEDFNQDIDDEDDNTASNDVHSNHFQTVMCPRNIFMIGGFYSTISKGERWSGLAKFIKYLLSKKFLSDDSFTEQCLALYSQDWPQSVLEGLASCIKDVAGQCDLSINPKVQILLEFLSEFCNNLDGDISPL